MLLQIPLYYLNLSNLVRSMYYRQYIELQLVLSSLLMSFEVLLIKNLESPDSKAMSPNVSWGSRFALIIILFYLYFRHKNETLKNLISKFWVLRIGHLSLKTSMYKILTS